MSDTKSKQGSKEFLIRELKGFTPTIEYSTSDTTQLHTTITA
jgi:hypothetical protein